MGRHSKEIDSELNDKELLIFEQKGLESTNPSISEGGKIIDFDGNYTSRDVPDYDVGGYFTLTKGSDGIEFNVCGGRGDSDNPDHAHAYVITVYGDKTASLALSHQFNIITPLDMVSLDVYREVIGREIGIRQIGFWNDLESARYLYLLMDLNCDNNWQMMHGWVDRGQYIAKLQKKNKGPIKSPPPYRDYPYDLLTEINSVTRIKVIGDKAQVDTHHLWCRQININKPVYSSFKWMDLPEVSHSVSSVIVKKQRDDEDIIGQVLWKSDNTLSHDNDKIQPDTYANADVSNTILFASGNGMFGIKSADAIWTGTDTRWYVNHHVFDSDVKNSMIQFNLLMGNADTISIQFGNRMAIGWTYDNTYAFGGYEFLIMSDGTVFSRVEYYYGRKNDIHGSVTRAFGLNEQGATIDHFSSQKEIGIRVSIQNEKERHNVVGSMWVDHDLDGNWVQIIKNRKWTPNNWYVSSKDVPQGRVDTIEITNGPYQGPKHHWGIGRYITADKVDNGSLVNKITVFKLSDARL